MGVTGGGTLVVTTPQISPGTCNLILFSLQFPTGVALVTSAEGLSLRL